MEDNHLFGEDSEIAEGATEKMITGGGRRAMGFGGNDSLKVERIGWRFADRFFWGKKMVCFT